MSAPAPSSDGRPRTALRLFRDTRGAVAVEFAFVGGTLLLTIVFIAFVGLLLYMSQALDRATSVAARQIMIGAVQKQGMSQSAFVTGVLCPALPAAFNCNNLVVSVQTIAEAAQPAGYYAYTNSNQTSLLLPQTSALAPGSNGYTPQFSPGLQGNYVYMQVVYPFTALPSFMAPILGAAAKFNGSPAYLAISTAAFRNEQY